MDNNNKIWKWKRIPKEKREKYYAPIYLGYLCIMPEMGSEGYGGYQEYAICTGWDPEDVIRDYHEKLDKKFDKNNIRINEETGEFYYHDYFSTYFLELPPEHVYLPLGRLKLHKWRKEENE